MMPCTNFNWVSFKSAERKYLLVFPCGGNNDNQFSPDMFLLSCYLFVKETPQLL
jgi:hypothetical protein